MTIIQSEHKVFPWLQTFITRKLSGIQTLFFLPLLKLVYEKTSSVELHFEKIYVFIPRSFLVISVRNHGKTLCSPCIYEPTPHKISHDHSPIFRYLDVYYIFWDSAGGVATELRTGGPLLSAYRTQQAHCTLQHEELQLPFTWQGWLFLLGFTQ